MTADTKDPRAELNKLAKLLVEDLFNTPEAELLQEAAKDESLKQAGNMAKNAYQNAMQAVGAKRLQAARAGMKSASNQPLHDARPIDAAAAHKIIAKLIAANDSQLTLAARNLNNASDEEAIEWVRELYELGAIDKDFKF
jgi:predicted acylesterase/phospholipase RssA